MSQRTDPPKKYYAVAVGRNPGIYTTWEQCEAQVSEYPGMKHKSFKTRQEAVNWLGEQGVTQGVNM
jgi:ribonuclease HI